MKNHWEHFDFTLAEACTQFQFVGKHCGILADQQFVNNMSIYSILHCLCIVQIQLFTYIICYNFTLLVTGINCNRHDRASVLAQNNVSKTSLFVMKLRLPEYCTNVQIYPAISNCLNFTFIWRRQDIDVKHRSVFFRSCSCSDQNTQLTLLHILCFLSILSTQISGAYHDIGF